MRDGSDEAEICDATAGEQEAGELVSVIVVTYNAAAFVLETLDSIREQSYEPLELIVADDGSRDGTVVACRDWIAKHGERFTRCEVVTVPTNTGTTANCNRGIRAARGNWLKLIAGDDALMPDAIATFVAHARAHPDVRFMHADVAIYLGTFDEAQREAPTCSRAFQVNQPGLSARQQFEILLRCNKIWAPTVMAHRSVFDEHGLYDETAGLWEDLPLFLRLTRAGIRLHFVDFIAVRYRRSPISVQRANATGRPQITRFECDVARYYLDHYLSELPLWERTVRGTLHRRTLALHRLGLRSGKRSTKLITKATGFPWVLIERKIVEHYR